MAQFNGRAATRVNGPISVNNNVDLDFGTIIPGTAPTIFVLNPNDSTLDITGDALSAGGTISRAEFAVFGSPNAQYIITIDTAAVVLTQANGSATIPLTNLRISGVGNGNGLAVGRRRLDGDGNAIFGVGGTIAVLPNQAGGRYTGTFSVTVNNF